MRTGACIVQHGLRSEAAGVVNQAVTLRRGHAQVTPLHVANVLLSSSSGAGLLRAACLRFHSQPLRCRALELCFNVALNRLPSAAPPLFSPPAYRLPSLSNALVAAFKRAQANQRRGSSAAVDSAAGAHPSPPPQPLLAVMIEVEHLVVSILDDPSVSRVMREAGFCSTQVKTNVENALSPENGEIAPPNSDLISPKSIEMKPLLKNVVDDEALLTINPAVSLGLSLNFNSDLDQGRLLIEEGDRSTNYSSAIDIPARHSKNYSALGSTLPSWLQQHKEDSKRRSRVADDYDDLQREAQLMLNFSSPSPCDSSSSSSISSSLILHHGGVKLNLSSENPCSRSSNLQMHLEKSTTSPYVNFYPNPNSTASSSTVEMEYIPKYKELNAENLKILCAALEKKVPWQREIIPKIAGTVLQCRSGMTKRKGDHREPWKLNLGSEEGTWMLFSGSDAEGQRKISEELASLIFSSPTNFVQISNVSPPAKDYCYRSRKRSRKETSGRCSYLERLFEEISENPHRAFLIGDIEQVDRRDRERIKNAIEKGRIRSCSGEEEVSVSDTIVILSCKSLKSRSRFCRSPARGKEEDTTHLSLDLNLNLAAPAHDLDDDGDSFDGVGIMELVDGAFWFD